MKSVSKAVFAEHEENKLSASIRILPCQTHAMMSELLPPTHNNIKLTTSLDLIVNFPLQLQHISL